MKAPVEKTTGYTVVAVLAAIVLYLVAGSVTGSLYGRAALGGFGGAGPWSSVSGEGAGGFDNGSVGGALQGLAKSAESASKEMAAAQKSGDTNAQAAAAGKAMAAILGGGAAAVEALPPDRMKTFLPASLAGLKLTESSASRSGAMGMQIAEAKARYGADGGQSVELEVTDMGSAKGLMGLASWVNVEEDKQTQTGYEKTYKQGENMVHEQWNNQSHSGEYSLVLAQRFVVKVSGSATSEEQLKSYLSAVDLAGLAALRNEGVKQN